MPLPAELLDQFNMSPVFVETGSHRGDGIQAALDAGFTCVYSVDILPFAYGWCCHRYQDVRDMVHLACGDSRPWLQEVLAHSIGSPSVFWLDAHWCGGDGEMDGHDVHAQAAGAPLLDELEIIGRHRIRSHAILIDDVRQFGSDEYFPGHDEVLDALSQINAGYEISYADSPAGKGDILVAKVPW